MDIYVPDNYCISEILGSGTYGNVYLGTNLKTFESVALKYINIQYEEEGIPLSALREISILKKIEHPNIIQLKDIYYDQQNLILIQEKFGIDLRQWMMTQTELCSEQLAKIIIYQILQGVNYCHTNRIIHRDIKPQNILIEQLEKIKIKIVDFGLSRKYLMDYNKFTNEIVTLWYRPPEILLGQDKYNLNVDMWSIGCILYELIEGQICFEGDSEIDQIFKIFQKCGTPNQDNWPKINQLPHYKEQFPQWETQQINCNLSKQGNDLLNQMLCLDPEKRIGSLEALNHEYFDDIKDQI